jgi:hypothetical protein
VGNLAIGGFVDVLERNQAVTVNCDVKPRSREL